MPRGIEVGLSPGDFMLDGDAAPLPKKGLEPPNFRPCLLWPNGWMDQAALGMELGLGPGHIVLDGDLAPFYQKGGRAPTPNFRPISIVAKRLDASRCHLVSRYFSAQATLC